MSRTRTEDIATVDKPGELGGHDKAEPRRAEARASRPAGSGESPLRIYKPGQGAYVRWGSAAGAGVIAVAAAQFLYEQLGRFEFNETVRFVVPVMALVALAGLIFRLIGQNRRFVDFLVATEAEMRKVHWSSRREVLGATRVVIVVLLALGMYLFLVDWVFIVFFESIGVLRVETGFNIFKGTGE